jgi:hypothetical protein
VLGVPELGHDEKVFTVYNALFNALTDCLPYLLLVSIERSTINETVSLLDSKLDGFVDFIVIFERIESTKSN